MPISWLQEISFIPPPWPSRNSKGRVQIVVNQGKEGVWDKRGTVKRKSAAWGRGSGSSSRRTHNSIFKQFCRNWTHPPSPALSLPVGEVDCLLPARILTPHQLEPEGWWCWLLVTSPPTNQKNVPALSTPSLNHHYAASHYPLQAGIHSSVGSSPLCPPLSGQTVKLLFSTSSRTLSLRFNLVSGYKDQIRLQEYTRSLWKININADVCVKISSVTSPVAIPNSNSLC